MPKTNKKDPVFYYSESKDKHIDIDTMSDVHIKRAFKKIVKGSDKVMKNKKAAKDTYYEEESNNVYVFNNVMFNFNMYINAENANEAMEKFDQCGFAHRDHWKVMVELSEQPSEEPDGS